MDGDESVLATLERYIRRKEVSGDAETLLRHLVSTEIETDYGASIADMSLAAFNEDEEFKGGDVFVVSGYDALLTQLSHGLDIRLRAPVSAILDTGAGVRISVGAEEFHADYAVVTLPLGVLKKGSVRFSPPLSPTKARALNGLGMGNLHRLFSNSRACFGTTAAHQHRAWRADLAGILQLRQGNRKTDPARTACGRGSLWVSGNV